MPALRELKQKGLQFKASLGYLTRKGRKINIEGKTLLMGMSFYML